MFYQWAYTFFLNIGNQYRNGHCLSEQAQRKQVKIGGGGGEGGGGRMTDLSKRYEVMLIPKICLLIRLIKMSIKMFLIQRNYISYITVIWNHIYRDEDRHMTNNNIIPPPPPPPPPRPSPIPSCLQCSHSRSAHIKWIKLNMFRWSRIGKLLCPPPTPPPPTTHTHTDFFRACYSPGSYDDGDTTMPVAWYNPSYKTSFHGGDV